LAVSSIRPKAGRPRALKLEQIVDAAIELGLEKFTMKGVAAELGVTIATVYKYVRDRDHLFRLAVDEVMASTRVPKDLGQHWSEYVIEFAQAVGTRLTSDRLILDRMIHWGIGLETELRLSEVFTEAMMKRGFTGPDASQLLQHLGMAAFGAAVRVQMDSARVEAHGSLKRAIDETLLHFDEEEIRNARKFHPSTVEPVEKLVVTLLAPLIAQIAASRGEPCPGILQLASE
jgi:AcrR family transcriptional regulator